MTEYEVPSSIPLFKIRAANRKQIKIRDAACCLAGLNPHDEKIVVDEKNPCKTTILYYWLKLEFLEKNLVPVSYNGNEEPYFTWADIFKLCKKRKRDVDTQLVSIWTQLKVTKKINVRLNKAIFQYAAAYLWEGFPNTTKRDMSYNLFAYFAWEFKQDTKVLLLEQDEEQIYQMLKGMSPYSYTGNPKGTEKLPGQEFEWMLVAFIFYDNVNDMDS